MTHENVDSFEGPGHTALAFQDEDTRKDPIDLPDAEGIAVPPKTLPRSKLAPSSAQRHWLSC